MKLKNLVMCYIYSPISIKVDGETTKKWIYKNCLKLNVQQDINELDKNSAGIIDYDRLRVRTDYDVNINKNDGFSLYKLELDSDSYTKEPPKYVVIANPKLGKTTTYTCEIYHGE